MDKQYDPNVTPKKQVFSAQIDLKKFEKATDEEKKQQDVMSESTTFFRDGMRKLMKNPLAVLSLILLAIILITIIVAPMIVPYKYEEIMSINGKRDKGAKNLAPFTYSKMEQQYIDQGGTRFPHIFGTDEQCRDYFIRVVYGTRVSLSIGVFASLIVLIIGMIYGSISGYVGGRTDLIMMRIVDIIYSLPDMLVIILISVVLDQVLDLTGSPLAKLGTNMVSIFIVFGLLYWVGMARSDPRPDPFHQAERIHSGCARHRREAGPHHQAAHPAELSFGHHHLRGPSGAVRHLHRELSELPRPWRPRADAVARLVGECCARGPAKLSV